MSNSNLSISASPAAGERESFQPPNAIRILLLPSESAIRLSQVGSTRQNLGIGLQGELKSFCGFEIFIRAKIELAQKTVGSEGAWICIERTQLRAFRFLQIRRVGGIRAVGPEFSHWA